MKINSFITPLPALALTLFIASCSRPAGPEVAIDGDTVKIKAGTHYITAEKQGDLSGQGVLFGCTFFADKNIYITGSMSFIEKEVFDEIKSRYPDLHKCSSAGAREAKNSVTSVALIPANSKMNGQISRMAQVFGKLDKRIMATFKGIEITLKEYRVKEGGEEGLIPLDKLTRLPHYLIEELNYEELAE